MIPRFRYDLRWADLLRYLRGLPHSPKRTLELFARALQDVTGTTGFPTLLTSSGREAIRVALRMLPEPGEVLVPAYCCKAVPEAIVAAACRPVFVDVDARSLNLDLARAEAAITPQTRAVLAVHLFGNPLDMPRLERLAAARGLCVVNDCASSLGARLGGRPLETFGDLTILSFGAMGKNITAGGGGALIGRPGAPWDASVEAAQSRVGWFGAASGLIMVVGYAVLSNPRLFRFVRPLTDKLVGDSRKPTEAAPDARPPRSLRPCQALLGTIQFQRYPNAISHLRRLAAAYEERLCALEGIQLQETLPDASPSRNRYAIRVLDESIARDRLLEHLVRRKGIDATTPLAYSTPALFGDAAADACPVAGQVAQSIVGLPIHAKMLLRDAEDVADSVVELVRGAR